MRNDLKPDFGQYLLNNFSPNTVFNFTDVQICELAYVGPNLYSFSSTMNYFDKEFLASFDFTTKELIILLDSLNDNQLRNFLRSKLRVAFLKPLKIDLQIPIDVGICTHLGNGVQSLFEPFVPLIIEEFYSIIEFPFK